MSGPRCTITKCLGPDYGAPFRNGNNNDINTFSTTVLGMSIMVVEVPVMVILPLVAVKLSGG